VVGDVVERICQEAGRDGWPGCTAFTLASCAPFFQQSGTYHVIPHRKPIRMLHVKGRFGATRRSGPLDPYLVVGQDHEATSPIREFARHGGELSQKFIGSRLAQTNQEQSGKGPG
jgi:hypothetical protein